MTDMHRWPEDVQFPGIENPTPADHLALELAQQQLNLVFGIRAIRAQRGLTPQAVAEAMDVDLDALWRLEMGGSNPTMSTIRRYAKAVGAHFQVTVSPWDGTRFEKEDPDA